MRPNSFSFAAPWSGVGHQRPKQSNRGTVNFFHGVVKSLFIRQRWNCESADFPDKLRRCCPNFTLGCWRVEIIQYLYVSAHLIACLSLILGSTNIILIDKTGFNTKLTLTFIRGWMIIVCTKYDRRIPNSLRRAR
jgi:hypothetical protein